MTYIQATMFILLIMGVWMLGVLALKVMRLGWRVCKWFWNVVLGGNDLEAANEHDWETRWHAACSIIDRLELSAKYHGGTVKRLEAALKAEEWNTECAWKAKDEAEARIKELEAYIEDTDWDFEDACLLVVAAIPTRSYRQATRWLRGWSRQRRIGLGI